MSNKIIHVEVVGKDGDKLQKFYSDVFGWSLDTNNPGGYGLLRQDDLTAGIGAASDGGAGHVTFYIGADDPQAPWPRWRLPVAGSSCRSPRWRPRPRSPYSPILRATSSASCRSLRRRKSGSRFVEGRPPACPGARRAVCPPSAACVRRARLVQWS